MKLLRIITKGGYFIRDDVTFNEETEIGLDLTDEQVAQFNSIPFFKRRWNFETEQFEEAATPEEIAALQATPEAEPAELEQRVETIENIIVEILEV